MSDSLGEQVNIRLTGGELPDAVQAVGAENLDINETIGIPVMVVGDGLAVAVADAVKDHFLILGQAQIRAYVGPVGQAKACKSPINLLKFYDQWYTGENVMQLQYGPIGGYAYVTLGALGKILLVILAENLDINEAVGIPVMVVGDEEAREKFGKSAGELKAASEVQGPKLILSEYEPADLMVTVQVPSGPFSGGR